MNDANINVLAERVDTAITGFAKIEGMIAAMTANQSSLVSQIAVFQERMAQVHLTVQRQSNVIDSQGEDIEKMRETQQRISEEVSGQKLMWKLIGAGVSTVAGLALTLVIWSFQRMEGVTSTLAVIDRRIAIVEISFGMRNSQPTFPPNQQGTKP